MGISTAIAVFFLIWWIVLFAVLPWGVRSQGEEGSPGTDPGAPVVTRLRTKLIWTTVIAAAMWGICAAIYINGWITLDSLSALTGFPQQYR